MKAYRLKREIMYKGTTVLPGSIFTEGYSNDYKVKVYKCQLLYADVFFYQYQLVENNPEYFEEVKEGGLSET